MSDKIPTSLPVEVLPADTAGAPLNFTIREYLGSPVYRWSDVHEEDKTPLTGREDLKPGDAILVPALTGGYYKAYVTGDHTDASKSCGWDTNPGEPQGAMGFLEFGADDRNCWICTGVVNKRGIQKLELTSDG